MPPETPSLESVTASIAKVSDLIEKANQRGAAEKTELMEYVKTLVKDALAGARGNTKTMEFDIAPGSREKDILRKLPKSMQQQLDSAFLLGKALNIPVNKTKYWNETVRPELGDIHKALADASNKGAEWVPDDFSSQLWEMVRLETKVAQQYVNVPMPTPTYLLPLQVGRIQTYTHAAQTGDTGQTLTVLGDPSVYTGQITLTAKAHVGAVLMNKDIEEDSIIDLMPQVQSDIITSLAEGRDDAILNGDSNATHEDSDTEAVTGHRNKMWLGLRAQANDNSYVTDLSTLTELTVLSLRGNMGRYGASPKNLFFVTGTMGLIRLMGLGMVTTLEKYGPGATILAGELGKLWGIPLIVSEWVREDLNASNVYASGALNTCLYLAHNRGQVFGVRRNAEVQVLRELYARSRQDAIQVTERVAFSPTYPLSTNKTSWVGSQIAIS